MCKQAFTDNKPCSALKLCLHQSEATPSLTKHYCKWLLIIILIWEKNTHIQFNYLHLHNNVFLLINNSKSSKQTGEEAKKKRLAFTWLSKHSTISRYIFKKGGNS